MYLQWWFKATPFIGDPQAMLGLLKGYQPPSTNEGLLTI